MRYTSIKKHLRPHSITTGRKTTINNAFASAIAPHDKFDEQIMREAVSWLGQDPDNDLRCAYCDSEAGTWDHVNGIVKSGRFSGFGHRVGNLLPCCTSCNSKKGNKDWKDYIAKIPMSDVKRASTLDVIQSYLDRYLVSDPISESLPEVIELEEIKNQIFELMIKADDIASGLRTKLVR